MSRADALVELLTATLGTLPGRRVFARMPVHTTVRDHDVGLLDTVRRVAPAGVAAVDFGAIVPDDEFVSAAHLDERGHARLAAAVADLLAR